MTDREFLRIHGFTDKGKDSLRRAIIKWFKANQGKLTKEDKAFLFDLVMHTNAPKS